MTSPMHGAEIAGKTVEAFTACAETSEKLLRELVDLSTTSSKEGVRLYAEMQSAAVQAMKDGQAAFLGAQAAWQDNALAITRSAERLQVSAEQAAKEIQAAFGQLAGRVKSLYSTI